MFKSLFDYDVYFFDLDGTIIDSNSVQEKAWKCILEKYGCSVEENFYEHIKGLPTRLVIHKFINNADPFTIDRISKEKTDLYLQFSDYVSVFVSVNNLLRDLKDNNKDIFLYTGASSRSVNYILEKFSLKKYFKNIITSDDGFKPKPDPDFYNHMVKLLNVPKNRCLVIEDSYNGILSAKLACINCLEVKNGELQSLHKYCL